MRQDGNAVEAYARHLQQAGGVLCAVFDYGIRDFSPDIPGFFCPACPLAKDGSCDFHTAHRYGCFEAERWNGLYIYYCPASLAFVSTVVYERDQPAYALVAGPVVMGSDEDLPQEAAAKLAGGLAALPRRTPAETNALARVQWAVAMYLSGRQAGDSERQSHNQSGLLNTLYDITAEVRASKPTRYPLEIEQKLQRMITRGDRQGAQELINQLLGALYFNTGADFAAIKAHAKDLVVLFSRASIEGGADVQKIFGNYRSLAGEIEAFTTLDQLSAFLTGIFYRFVGYVFDFSQFEHADALRKASDFVRENYAQKLTLQQLAGHVGLSRSTLSAVFKQELGATFTDYVNAVRVEKSEELLADPRLSLAEIADLVGFYDQSYYTKVFTRVVGVSPGQYRKKGGHSR